MDISDRVRGVVNAIVDGIPGADRRAEIGLTAQEAVEAAAAAYIAASDAVAELDAAKAAAKAVIEEIMSETGNERWSTPEAEVLRSAAGPSISYDSKALDALAASSDEVDRLLRPHRKVSMRPGSIVIRRKSNAGATLRSGLPF